MSFTVTYHPGDALKLFGLNTLNDKEITISAKEELHDEEIIEVVQTASDLRLCQADLKKALDPINLAVLNHAPTEWTEKPEYTRFINVSSALRDADQAWRVILEKHKITEYKESFTQKRILVGFIGGTGSGKSVLSTKVKEIFGEHAVLLKQDNYYKGLSTMPKEERAHVNFDHPDALDWDQFETNVNELRVGHTITEPQYDFIDHVRKPVGETVKSAQIILTEGILIGAVEKIRALFDILVFVDTPDDIRILRRLKRDTKERGRTIKSVMTQYTTTVKPMHDQFVAPSRQYANLIVPGFGPAATIDETAKRVADMIEARLARMQTDITNGRQKQGSAPSSPLRGKDR